MKKIQELINRQRHSAVQKIVQGKKITKAEAQSLAINSLIEFGCIAGQFEERDFPSAYDYCPDLNAEGLYDRMPDSGPSETDLENHAKFVNCVNDFYWSMKCKFFG